MPMPPVKRVLLKLSGEVLMGDQPFGLDPKVVGELAIVAAHLLNPVALLGNRFAAVVRPRRG